MSEAYLDYTAAMATIVQREAEDLGWATANTKPVREGLWGIAPGAQVFYVGVRTDGERIGLGHIPSQWRYKPSEIRLGGSATCVIAPDTSGPTVVRIELAPSMPGILARRPEGRQPMQMDGLIDGQDFYFREDKGFWSLSVGGSDVINAPDWHHEDQHDIDGWISEEQAYALLATGASLFRTRGAEQE